ncbi:hypothetical protein [Actinomycetospora flava]|uniref:Uncharacterized protein n=1 Tax=Actinomycetospora flava TaxID=3129232 RepID=A0ABU8M265_9PSEU
MAAGGFDLSDVPALLASARAHADASQFVAAQERARAVLDLVGSDERFAEARRRAESVLKEVGRTPAKAWKRQNKPAARRRRAARLSAKLSGRVDPVDVAREQRRREEEQQRDRAASEIHNSGRMGNEAEAASLRILGRHPERISGRPQARKVVDRLARDADIARSLDNTDGEETAKARIEEIRDMFGL